MSLKICVYAICKNESAFAARWMESMKEADLVVVADTGSTDDSVQLLREAGAEVYSETVNPWRFDVARNISLAHVPEDIDICICADLDEVFEPGWRKILEESWIPEATRARYIFTWDFNSDGSPGKQSIKEKIHRRHGFKWVHPVHEVLEYSGSDPDNSIFIEGLMLGHYPDKTKPRTQYLPLLELSAEENPQDPQTIFWLGREYVFYNEFDKAIPTLKKYLDLPNANWNEERSAAMRFISAAYEVKGDIKNAKKWIFRAIGECPFVREPYMSAAKLAYQQSDWPLAFAMTKSALKITKSSGSYLTEHESWGYLFYDLCAISAYHLGIYDEARIHAEKALEFAPEDSRLQNNLKIILSKQKSGGSDSNE